MILLTSVGRYLCVSSPWIALKLTNLDTRNKSPLVCLVGRNMFFGFSELVQGQPCPKTWFLN